MRKLMLVVVSLAFLTLFSGAAFAFHDGGVAYCGGCHTMHNSNNGLLVDPAHPNGNAYLLKFSSATDLCLSCHATSRGAVWGTDPLNPPAEKGAGNFVFLTEDNINDGHGGATSPIPGRAAGHTVNSPARGVGPDGTLITAPGGTFPANRLECSSCHDPHGNQNFRLLYGVGPVQVNLTNFVNPAPDADGNSYNDCRNQCYPYCLSRRHERVVRQLPRRFPRQQYQADPSGRQSAWRCDCSCV